MLPFDQCGHLFHPDCAKSYFNSKIDDKSLPLKCPLPECKLDIAISDIQMILLPEEFQKFEKFTFDLYIEKNNDSYNCCPTPNCPFVYQWVPMGGFEMNCPVCEKKYCLKCKVEFHEGQSCKEYEINHKIDPNDDKFLKFVRGKHFKQCPKCKYWVERSMGCDTMSCRCGCTFCYACGADKGAGNHVCKRRPGVGGIMHPMPIPVEEHFGGLSFPIPHSLPEAENPFNLLSAMDSRRIPKIKQWRAPIKKAAKKAAPSAIRSDEDYWDLDEREQIEEMRAFYQNN